MDDLNDSVNTLNDAIQVYETSKKCFADGNSYVHKWVTNSKELIKFTNKRTESVTQTTINDKRYMQTELGTSDKYSKVLGINWDTNNDTVVIEFEKLDGDEFLKRDVTKRNILNLSASTSDPLSLICVLFYQAKYSFKNYAKTKSIGTVTFQILLLNNGKSISVI